MNEIGGSTGMWSRKQRRTMDVIRDVFQRRNRLQFRAHPCWMSFSQEQGHKSGQCCHFLEKVQAATTLSLCFLPSPAYRTFLLAHNGPGEVGRGPAAVQPREARPGQPTTVHPTHTSGSTFAFFSCRCVFWFPIPCCWSSRCKMWGGR